MDGGGPLRARNRGAAIGALDHGGDAVLRARASGATAVRAVLRDVRDRLRATARAWRCALRAVSAQGGRRASIVAAGHGISISGGVHQTAAALLSVSDRERTTRHCGRTSDRRPAPNPIQINARPAGSPASMRNATLRRSTRSHGTGVWARPSNGINPKSGVPGECIRDHRPLAPAGFDPDDNVRMC